MRKAMLNAGFVWRDDEFNKIEKEKRMTELLRKAAALWQHAQADGKTITRDEMAQVLQISDRRAGEILFALKNRNLLELRTPAHSKVEAGAVEMQW